MSAEARRLREIGFPLRLGEWTLATPTRRLVARRSGVLERPVPEAELNSAGLPPGADGYLLVRPIPDAAADAAASDADPDLLRWVMRRGPRHYIRLDGTFDDYLGRFSSKTRSGLRRKRRRLERESGGAVRFAAYGPGAFAAFHEAARAVSRRTYQEIMFDAGLPDDEEDIAAMERAMDAGDARGFLLFVDEMPVAYLYCPRRDGVDEYQYVGFRPDYGQWSPGTVLLLAVLEHLFADPDAVAFDFTEGAGEGSHKAFYATDSVDFETVVLLRRNLRNRALIALREMLDRLSGSIGGLLRRFGLKEHVRVLLRRARGVPREASPR